MRYFFCTIHKTKKRSEVSDEYAVDVLHKHTDYFVKLGKEDKCLVAGPFVDQKTEYGGGCYILIAEDEESARSLAEDDPLVIEGLYSFRMVEWKKVV